MCTKLILNKNFKQNNRVFNTYFQVQWPSSPISPVFYIELLTYIINVCIFVGDNLQHVVNIKGIVTAKLICVDALYSPVKAYVITLYGNNYTS